ncbi:MAG: adenylosuccinate synthetase [Lachnospiraceae bacterium]|nr:adenylosuccinate synthetase [Lachnospiraceae bacterium]
MVYAVIGSNYGDEGKGLVTAYLTDPQKKTLGIRHNGGAQSGHTVEDERKRFVFHEVSSGAFFGADTYWAETYLPDMYKLKEEIDEFVATFGKRPIIYASADACITTIDDVLINMALEQSRDERHGSCGMGINEADLRYKAGFGISFKELMTMGASELADKLKKNREQYSYRRLEKLGLADKKRDEYLELLYDEAVLYNYAEAVIENLKYVTVINDAKELFESYETIIFENGQGLRLDAEFKGNWPHVTASRTGLTNIVNILENVGIKPDEVVYVTRSYVTKHGAGPLVNESIKLEIDMAEDKTNIPNPWQGEIRYSQYTNTDELLTPIINDMSNLQYKTKASLFITHLNESDDKMLFSEGNISVNDFLKKEEITNRFQRAYLSYSPYVKSATKIKKLS